MTNLKKTQEKIREQVGHKFSIPKPPIKRQIYVMKSKDEAVKIKERIESREGSKMIEEKKQTTIEKYVMSKTYDKMDLVPNMGIDETEQENTTPL